jgi:SPRY domain
MADWYVSSAKFATVPAWVGTHAYNVGDFVKATAPASQKEYVWRCTTAGTSSSTEPTWSTSYADSSTKIDGGVTWTNVTGQSAYGWNAAAGTLACIDNTNSCRPLAGDRVFLSSDHSESFSSINITYGFNNGAAAFGSIQVISVNRAGSVPPVAADITPGAALTLTPAAAQALSLDALCNMFWQGININLAGSVSAFIQFNLNGLRSNYLKNCAIVFSNTNATSKLMNGGGAKAILDNVTIQFGNVGQYIGVNTYTFELTWLNTASAIVGATVPTILFSTNTSGGNAIVCRGVDLSAVTGTLLVSSAGGAMKALFDSCRIASGVTRLAAPTTSSVSGDELELINCYDGANTLNERYRYAGSIVTDRSTYLTSGAQDDIGNYSLKLVSSSRSDFASMPLDCFWFDVENALTGSSKTATVEITSSAALNNNDIRLLLEYMGTAGSPVASFGDTLSSVLASVSALPSSSNTWVGTSYTTWNANDTTGTVALSNANLTAALNSATNCGVRANTGLGSGKYYFEVTMTTWSNTNCGIGLALSTALLGPSNSTVGSILFAASGVTYLNGSQALATWGARSSGDIIGIAVDLSAQLIWFRVAPSGNWNGSGTANPATGTGGVSFSGIGGTLLFPAYSTGVTGQVATADFGASAFSGTVPSGFTSGWPGTPASKQLLQVVFTPQVAGRVRGLVQLGKPSTTVWVNPQIAIT